MFLVGTDAYRQQSWLDLLLRAPEASLTVGWTVSAKQFEARLLGAECTVTAETESYRTPIRCLRAVRQRQEVCCGLREQRRCLERRDACSGEYYLNFVTFLDPVSHPGVQHTRARLACRSASCK